MDNWFRHSDFSQLKYQPSTHICTKGNRDQKVNKRIDNWKRWEVESSCCRGGPVITQCWLGPLVPGISPLYWAACIISNCTVLHPLLGWYYPNIGGAPPSTPSQGSRARAKLRPNWTKYVDLDNCALWGAPVQFWLKMIDSNVVSHWSLFHALALDRNMTNFMRYKNPKNNVWVLKLLVGWQSL